MRLGIDIVQLSRIRTLLSDPSQAASVFAPEEMTDDLHTMAGRFAAKEAYFKALGAKSDWRSIQVMRRESGEPYLVCPKESRTRVSISHDGEYAVAVVLIEDL